MTDANNQTAPLTIYPEKLYPKPQPMTPQYPPPQYQPAPGMAPYPQPQYYPQPPPQQQQQQQSSNVVVIGGQPAPVIIQKTPQTNFTAAIVFSCLVFWCCGWIFGLIAFILAMIGHSSASSGDETIARPMLLSSYGLSIAGVVIGIIVIIIVVVVQVKSCHYGYRFENGYKICCNTYDWWRDCYTYKTGVASSECCPYQ